MTLPPLPEIPSSPESKLRWIAWGQQCAKAGMLRAAVIADKLTTAIDHGGNGYRREATASQCVAAIRAEMQSKINPLD